MHAHAVAATALALLLAGAQAVRADDRFITGMREKTSAAPAPSGGAAASNEEVDESALRYYASMRQTARVEVETSRLQRLHPGWKPPADLYRSVEPGGGDEEELWTLFSLDKIAELHAAIEERKEAQPGWKPSHDLLTKLARKELRLKVISLVNQNESEVLFAFIKSASLQPNDMDLDVQWMLAEAYAKAKQVQEARTLFQSILAVSKPGERVATIQKAMAALPMSQVELLLSSVPDARSEFAAIWPDITRSQSVHTFKKTAPKRLRRPMSRSCKPVLQKRRTRARPASWLGTRFGASSCRKLWRCSSSRSKRAATR